MPIIIDDYASSVRSSGLPLFGFLAWNWVSGNAWADYADMARWVEESGAPISMPNRPGPGNTFHRACSEANQGVRRVATADPAVIHKFELVPAGYDADRIFKKLILRRTDTLDHELSHAEIGTVNYNRKTRMVEAESEVFEPTFESMVRQINEYMATRGAMLNEAALRSCFVRAVEGALNGVAVKPSGGIYYVQPDHATELDALTAVADQIGQVDFRVMPLADDPRQRAMVKEAFENEATDALRTLNGEVGTLLAKGEITTADFNPLLVKFQDRRQRVAEYAEVLGEVLESVNTSMDLCWMQLETAFERAV